MDFLKKNKTPILAGIGMLAVLYIYLTYFSGSSAPLTATNPETVSGDLLVTLNNLHTIRLDQTVFSDPVFVSLSDFGVTLPAQPAGRRNPFAPIGQGNLNAGAPSTQTTGTTKTTTTTTTKSPTQPAPKATSPATTQ